MSLLLRIQQAVRAGRVVISDHALDQMLKRHIDVENTVRSVEQATLLEDYSVSRGEPRVLVIQQESRGRVIHVVWDAPESEAGDAVLITAFYPDR